MYKYYLRIPEIDGESTDGVHARWMDIESASLSSSAKGSGASGKVTLEDFHFTKKMDKASLKLMEAAAKGKHFPRVTVEGAEHFLTGGWKGWQHKIIEYVFEDVIITSYSTSGSRGDDSPSESFTLNFKNLTYSYS